MHPNGESGAWACHEPERSEWVHMLAMNPSVASGSWSDPGRPAGITWMRRDITRLLSPDFILCYVALV